MTNQVLMQDIQALMEHASVDVLKHIHAFLEKSVSQPNSNLSLTEAQEQEVKKRIADFESGKGKNYSEEEALSIIRASLGK